MPNSAGFLKILLLLFIFGMPFSNIAQTPHAVKQSKSSVKPTKNKNKDKKVLSDEESKKPKEEEEDFPDGPGGESSSASESYNPSVTELLLLIAACVILPILPLVFSSKKNSGKSSNRNEKFRGWLKENKIALRGSYTTGIIVILLVYFFFFRSYESLNDSMKSHNDSINDLNEKIKNNKVHEGFKKLQEQQRDTVDSNNINKDKKF